MTENHESAADEHLRQAGTAPGMEGEGGQYMDGDVGIERTPAEHPAAGEYPGADGDGSEVADEAGAERLTDGQVNTTAQEPGPLHGDSDR